jgi:hypothetical protein
MGISRKYRYAIVIEPSWQCYQSNPIVIVLYEMLCAALLSDRLQLRAYSSPTAVAAVLSYLQRHRLTQNGNFYVEMLSLISCDLILQMYRVICTSSHIRRFHGSAEMTNRCSFTATIQLVGI